LLTDPLFLAVAIPAVVALGLSKGGFAGVGTIATPLIALVLPPFDAAALILPILIVQDVISLWVYRREWSAANLKFMLPGGALGVGLAWMLAMQLPEAVVRMIVGAVGVSFALSVWLNRNPAATKATARRGLFWGAVSGFTSTFANAGGPPFQIYVLPQQLPKLMLVGTSTIFFATVNWLKVIPYLALGNFSGHGLMLSLALMPLAIMANFLGIWLVRVTPAKTFYQIAYALVFLLSLALIWQGSIGLWQDLRPR
jgi:uncharacterized membrane protein YfcA